MHIEELLNEQERLLGQRADILRAMSPPVMASDLEAEDRDDLRVAVEQALDDVFFGLLDPVETDIQDHEAASAWRRQRADIIAFRGRQ